MEYRQARGVLQSLPSLEVKPGLERIERLVAHLGFPERAFPAIHVAGTNGKGSVTAMLASALAAAGYRVGRYTSPDLLDLRDRISVNGVWISERHLAAGVQALLPLLGEGEAQPTQFEALTAIAFRHFALESVDVAVVEVGLGGRFDATNIVQPVLSVLTNVGRDHLSVLGPTLERVAWEKAGIAKAQVPFVCGRLPEPLERVVCEECRRAGAEFLHAESVELEGIRFAWDGSVYRACGDGLPERIHLPLLGRYQEENLRLVLRATQSLAGRGFPLSPGAIAAGLAAVRWPGRFEVVSDRPRIVLDGAHNLPGIEALAGEVVHFLPEMDRRHLLFGALGDKEIAGMTALLFPLFRRVTLTRSTSPRALPSARIFAASPAVDPPATLTENVSEGVRRARAELSHEETLVIAGSLTVVAEARALLVGGGE